ncbi:pleckstrin homology domain-containing family F member 2-like [Myripristis murdjan]|uniref:pleckstrin homology domain-containing family F member 2-like n=1 Tax=Myripristis murdjan TaxID=586833 RepID=UPI001175E89C|nr:pleckstrin homology domain-containing family F member 2-like [Myripristis murdjan]
MSDQLTFTLENRDRIQAVESSFGPTGKPLFQPGRVLIGEGRLLKQSRRGPQPKAFFLFNDMLVYGSIILHGRWHKNQKIISLEDIELEDMEDGLTMSNQWLIRTPKKSFYVAAASPAEKRAWMEHIEECRSQLLQSASRRRSSTFAVTWIPDSASAICMRCSGKFSFTHRRHHCRHCGFVVCNSCSKERVVLEHIDCTKPLRVCKLCYTGLMKKENRRRGGSDGKSGSDEEDAAAPELELSSNEEPMESHAPSRWVTPEMDSWSPYVYLKPEHRKPLTT